MGKHYVAERIVMELRELTEAPTYAAKAAAIGHIVQAENGVGAACDAIEKQMSAPLLPSQPQPLF